MTIKPFSEDVLEILVETYKQVCLPVSEDITICQYLVEKGLAEYEHHAEVIKLTEKGQGLYQGLVKTVKDKLDL